MPLPRSGNTKYIPAPVVFEELVHEQVTGTLTFKKGGVEKAVYFQEGRVVFARSTDVRDRLGEVLIKMGKLSRGNLEQALLEHGRLRGAKKMGALLVEKRHVLPKDLFQALKIQVNEIIFSLFTWEQAEYAFSDELPDDVIPLQIDMAALIQGILARLKKT